MSTVNSRLRTLLSRFGTLLESLLVFILLFSGIGIVFISKFTGIIGAGMQLLSIGLAVQVSALVLLGLYFYIRFLRRGIVAE